MVALLKLMKISDGKIPFVSIIAVLAIFISLNTSNSVSKNQQIMTTNNAFHIFEKSIGIQDDDDDVMDVVRSWIDDGWTAQTGSLKTLCTHAPDRLVGVIPADSIRTACIMVR